MKIRVKFDAETGEAVEIVSIAEVTAEEIENLKNSGLTSKQLRERLLSAVKEAEQQITPSIILQI